MNKKLAISLLSGLSVATLSLSIVASSGFLSNSLNADVQYDSFLIGNRDNPLPASNGSYEYKTFYGATVTTDVRIDEGLFIGVVDHKTTLYNPFTPGILCYEITCYVFGVKTFYADVSTNNSSFWAMYDREAISSVHTDTYFDDDECLSYEFHFCVDVYEGGTATIDSIVVEYSVDNCRILVDQYA